MKKIISAAVFVALMSSLCGCSEQTAGGFNDDESSGSIESSGQIASTTSSSSAQSTISSSSAESSSQVASSQSSSSVISTASSSSTESSKSSSKVASSAPISKTSSSTSKPNVDYITPGEDFDGITVSNGKAVGINENAACNEIIIEKGGVLTVNGKIELLGDLYVEGKLEVSENAEIYGDGVIHVVNSFDDIDCKGTVTAKIDAPEPVEIDGVTYVGGILLVNKEYSLPKTYGSGLSDKVTEAVREMRKDSGFSMQIISGYRSYATQQATFANWCARYGEATARTLSAEPGHSEHQTGLAADITSIYTVYADTEEGKWLAENCYKYGCIIRYPKGKTDITGYIYEPWHIRYLGKSTAKLVHDSGLCLEEFLQLDARE